MMATNFDRTMPEAGPKVTICVLLFGEHFPLCERLFSRLFKHTQSDLFELRIGLNAVCKETADYVAKLLIEKTAKTYRSGINLYKGPMMRRMFYEDPIQTRWTIWFDDDSYPTRGDWLECLGVAMELFRDVDMFGQHLFIHPNDRLIAFLRECRWFRGLSLEREAPNGRPKIDFIAGGFWALRTRWIYSLDWPDPGIAHFEEDCILGEALRQNGAKIHNFTSGVEVNAATRRCGLETPASY